VRYLLDTNICIALVHRPELALKQRLAEKMPQDLVLCSIVKAELLYGARKSQRVAENLKELEAFFAPFDSVPFDDKAADFYGTTRALLAKAGTPIGTNDLFIAGIALAHDLVVVTRNRKEFVRVPGLRIEVW
jgi:tRNA(fMet)-specific endonuclease VapC